MIPDGIREKFLQYHKWLKMILKGDFINLPFRQQEKFIVMIESFLEHCRVIHKESEAIKERTIVLKIEQVIEEKNGVSVIGTDPQVRGIISIKYPKETHPPIGKKVIHTVYSLDGKIWHSSKEHLIRGV